MFSAVLVERPETRGPDQRWKQSHRSGRVREYDNLTAWVTQVTQGLKI